MEKLDNGCNRAYNVRIKYGGVKGMQVKTTVTLSDDLLKKVDECAKAMYLSRSAYIATALVQKMQQDVAMEAVPELLKRVRELEKRPN